MTASLYGLFLLIVAVALAVVAVVRKSRGFGFLAAAAYCLFLAYAGVLVIGLMDAG